MNQLWRNTSIILLLAFACGLNTTAQTPAWLWGKSMGGRDFDMVLGAACDANGNIYVAGTTEGDTLIFADDTLRNAGSNDVLLLKYDKNGNELWARSSQGSIQEDARAVATDRNGNVYVTGFFFDGSFIIDKDTLNNPGTSGAYLVKLDSLGNVLWSRAPANSPANAFAVATDNNNCVYFAGSFSGDSISFGSITLYRKPAVANYATALYLVKYDGAGNVLWAKSAGGGGFDMAKGLACDAANNVVMTGWFATDTIWFDNLSLYCRDTINLSGHTTRDIFTVKYDEQGNVLWANAIGGANNETAEAVAIDKEGNVIITTSSNSSTVFADTVAFNNQSAFSLLIKYDSTGKLVWGHIDKGSGGAQSITTDDSGNIYSTGYFTSQMIFGSYTLTNLSVYADPFFVKYNAAGNVEWATAFQFVGDGRGWACTSDNEGNIIVAGDLGGALIFGPDTIMTSGEHDIYVAKYGVEKTTVSINDHPYPKILLYPNPTSGRFNIQLPDDGGEWQLKIYNLMGACVFQSQIRLSQAQINFHPQPVGVYFIQLQSQEGKISSAKIIIE